MKRIFPHNLGIKVVLTADQDAELEGFTRLMRNPGEQPPT